MDIHQGPSQGVPDQLIQHLHLISTQRYALHSRVDVQKVTDWLLAAPKIARDTAAFYWTYLDTPGDGSVLLTWQPLARLGTEFASDGYIWSGPEIMYSHEVSNGVVLEIYHQRAGYKPMVEHYTLHSRRRFRLVPPKNPNPNMPPPQVDPGLWIVQYGPSDPQERIPATAIPVDARTSHLLNARIALQRNGNIGRKEFMLADRGNWPNIPMPRYGGPQGPRGPVPQSMAYPPSQGPGGGGGPGGKRGQRGGPQQHHGPPPPMAAMPGPPPPTESQLIEDEEDTSKGDMFDHMTPRDVSLARYQQNHLWMEDLLNSPYRLSQITMSDLGLGLKGELGGLTDGIFEAQAEGAHREPVRKPYLGTLDKGLAEEFRKRVGEHVESTTAEIQRIEAEHKRVMAEIEAGRMVTRAEKELRATAAGVGTEVWRLEGRLDSGDDSGGAGGSLSIGGGGRGRGVGGIGGGGGGRWAQVDLGSNVQARGVEEIVASVAGFLGRTAVEAQDVHRVQDGGYQPPPPVVEPSPTPTPTPAAEPSPIPQQQQRQVSVAAAAPTPPQAQQEASGPTGAGAGAEAAASSMSRHASQQSSSQHSGVLAGDSDVDMGGTAAGLLDQIHHAGPAVGGGGGVGGVSSSTSTPLNRFPTPQPSHLSAGHFNAGTPSAAWNVPSPQPQPQPQPVSQAQQAPPSTAARGDVEMGNAAAPAPSGAVPPAAEGATPPTAPDQGTGSGDWIVVPKSAAAPSPDGGGSNNSNSAVGAIVPGGSVPVAMGVPTGQGPMTAAPGVAVPAATTAGVPSAFPPTGPAALGGVVREDAAPAHSPNTAAAADAAGQVMHSNNGNTDENGSSKATGGVLTPGVFSSLGDIDGASDALAGFGDGGGGHMPLVGDDDDDDDDDALLNMDDDAMDMENSAFGDAFHGVTTGVGVGVGAAAATGAGGDGNMHGAAGEAP